jgi:hypothetical protein
MSNLNRPALARNVAAGQQASMGAKRMGQVGYRAAGQGIPATSQYFSPDHGFGGSNLRRLRNESAKPNDPLFGDQFDMDMDAGMDDDDTGMGSPRPQLPHHGNPLPGKPAGPWMPGDPGPSPYRPIGGPMPMPRGPRPTGGPRPQPSRPNTPWMPGDPGPSPYRPIGGPMPMPGGPRPATPTTPATHAPWKDRPAGALTLGGVTGSPGAQGPPGQAGAAGPSGNPGGSMGDPGVGSPQDFWGLPGSGPGDFSMGPGGIMGDRPYVPGAPYSDWSRPNPARPPGSSGFNPWTPPGGWGPADPGGFPLPTPPTVTPGPPPSPRPTPGPPPVVLPQILQGARDAMDWAQDAYEQDPTVQAIDKMERESAPQPGKTRRFPDANRVRNRGERKRDWAKRKTEEFKARREAERAQARMEQERLEAERAALMSTPPVYWGLPSPFEDYDAWPSTPRSKRVVPQLNDRPTSAFRPVNRLW